MHLQPGTLLQGGKYKIVRFIKSGGFGCTYEAWNTVFEERVAIKEFFPKDFCNREDDTLHVTVGTQSKKPLVSKLRKKFIDEAKAIRKLPHPGIVTVSDVFEENGTAYYVMDYIDGCSLDDLVKRNGALSEEEAMGYIRQVCSSLGYVHSQNRLHLDIKPGNIMVDGAGRAVLIDFGASKQYDEVNGENTSTMLGLTPGYAPSEQYNRGGISHFNEATDIYSLGATLYKLLSGLTPVDAPTRASGEHLAPLTPAVSKPVRDAVFSAMELDKTKRPQSVEDFMNHIFVQKDEFDNDRTSICKEQDLVEVESQDVQSPNDDRLAMSDSTAKIRFKDRKPFQNLSKLVIGLAVVINIYSFVEDSYLLCYYNMSYPHVLLLCLLVLFTFMGISAVWFLNLSHKRSRLMKTVFMLLLFSAGLLNSYLLVFDAHYIVKDDSCDNVYIEKSGLLPTYLPTYFDKYMVQDDIIPFSRWGKSGLKNGSTGEIVLPAKYNFYSRLSDISFRYFSKDLGWLDSDKEYDKNNNVIIEVERDGKHGVLNVKGDVVVPIVYDYWDSYYDKYIVGKEGKYGIISKHNEVILPLDYSGINYLASNSSYVVASKNGFWGVTDLKSRVHVTFEYEGIDLPDDFGDKLDTGMENTLFAYKRNGYWGVKDTSGKEYLSCEYDGIWSIDDFLEYGYWVVVKSGKCGVLNNASEVIVPFEYDLITLEGSQYGLFEVSNYHKRKGQMNGVINVNNEVILPLKTGSIHIDESVIVRESYYREKEIYNHLGERIN